MRGGYEGGMLGLGSGLEEVFVFDSKSENRLGSGLGSGLGLGPGLRLGLGSGLGLGSRLGLGLGLWLEEVLVFDSESENRDRAVEAIEAVPEARVRVRVDLV